MMNIKKSIYQINDTQTLNMTPENISAAIEDFIQRVKFEYKEKIKAIYMFGSCARGEYRENSDIDILVLLDMERIDAYSEQKNINQTTHGE